MPIEETTKKKEEMMMKMKRRHPGAQEEKKEKGEGTSPSIVFVVFFDGCTPRTFSPWTP